MTRFGGRDLGVWGGERSSAPSPAASLRHGPGPDPASPAGGQTDSKGSTAGVQQLGGTDHAAGVTTGRLSPPALLYTSHLLPSLSCGLSHLQGDGAVP